MALAIFGATVSCSTPYDFDAWNLPMAPEARLIGLPEVPPEVRAGGEIKLVQELVIGGGDDSVFRNHPRAQLLHGGETKSFGISFSTLQRSAVYVEPGVIVRVSQVGSVEFAVPISLSGQNWPAGPIFILGYFQQF